jgi:UDP-glucose 4-epimerase
MKCVVVGGGGFLGSHLSEALLLRGDSVIVFDQPHAPNLEILSNNGAKIEVGSFLNSDDLSRAIKGVDTIFHLVSTTVPKTSNADPIFDVNSNLIGTINLLNIAKETGVKKIVFSSSGGTVYGIPKEIPISENHPTNPISSYGITKLAIEKYLHLYWTLFNLDYSILRISNAYGERQSVTNTQGVIPTLIHRTLTHTPFNIWGDGTVIRDYIHVSDIVSGLLKASEFEGSQKLFNISSGIGYSVNSIIKMIELLTNETLKLNYEHEQAYDVPENILDNSLAKHLLDWEPSLDLMSGLRRTVDYMRQTIS